MATLYHQDIVAWANEQAALLRSGMLSAIDIENIAEEIEDVGKSEQRELASRMVVLLAHLLKWQFQPLFRSKSWVRTIAVQRRDVRYALSHAPSLQGWFDDVEWMTLLWDKAVIMASRETTIDADLFPETCPWTMEEVLGDEFFARLLGQATSPPCRLSRASLV